jgi:hypothetical protein
VAQITGNSARYLDFARHDGISEELDNPGLFERCVRAVLIDRFKSARCNANAHELVKLRHPDAVFVQIWPKDPGHVFCHMTANSALFLGQTAPVNNAAARRPRSCDTANS